MREVARVTMGTFESSKIQTATKAFVCAHCRGEIHRGERYLRYAAGFKNRFPVCLGCACSVLSDYKGLRDQGIRRYDCAAVRQLVSEIAARSPGDGP